MTISTLTSFNIDSLPVVKTIGCINECNAPEGVRISNIVFKDEEQLKSLNALVHPKVRKYFLHFVEITKAKIIIYESAILFESGSDKICDFIITVTANFNDRIERIVKRDGISKEQILERMKHQLNDEAKIKQSNFVINNSYSFRLKLMANSWLEN